MSDIRGIARSLIGCDLVDEAEIIGRSINAQAVCGVYFLIRNGRIVYVGQSVDIHSRVATHRVARQSIRTPPKEFDSFSYVECGAENIDIVESLYIHAINPELNKPQNHKSYKCAPLSPRELIEIHKREAQA